MNEAVRRARRGGILTAASLMVTAPDAAQAVAVARDLPGLDVGLHLVLAGSLPPASSNAQALTPSGGHFPAGPIGQGLRMFWSTRARGCVRREVAAQLDRFLAHGLPLAHLDGHMMLHVHPVVLDAIVRLAGDYPIRVVRLPREPLREALAFDGSEATRKCAEAAIFRLLSLRAAHRLAAAGIAHADAIRGLYQTGKITESYLLHVVTCLPPGTTELYAHPAVSWPGTKPVHPPHYDGERELAALCSPAVRAALLREGIGLIGTSALHPSGGRFAAVPAASASGPSSRQGAKR